MVDKVRRRLGEYLPRYGHVGRWRKAGKRTVGRELRDGLRLGPRQRATQRALAKPQTHRKQFLVIAGAQQPRAGEAHQRAAVFHPFDQRLARAVGNGSDVAHHDDGRLLLEQLRDRLGQVRARRFDKIGERLQRTANIVERREQQPGLVDRGLGQQPDPPALVGLVEHAHRAGMGLAVKRNRCKIVAQFERHHDLAGRHRFAGAEGDGGIADPAALVVKRAGRHESGNGAGRRANGGDGEAIDCVVGGGQADHVEPVRDRPDDACRALPEQRRKGLRVVPGRQPVGEDGDGRFRQFAERLGDARIDVRPISRDRARLHRVQPVARLSRGERADLRVGFFSREGENDRALVLFGIGDQPLGRGNALVPVAGACPAIVDHQRQRLAAGRQRLARVVDRLGDGQHDKRSHQQAQQRQPPGALMRRLFLLEHAAPVSSAAGTPRSAASAASAAAATRSPAVRPGRTGSPGSRS